MPHIARARFSWSRGAIVTFPASWVTSTSGGSLTGSAPSLPSALTVRPSTATVTPLGTATGCLPILDMSEHRAEDFTADARVARLGVGQDPARRRDDRDPEAVVDPRQVVDALVDPSAGLRHPAQLADHGLAVVVLGRDVQRALASAEIHRLEAADVALAPQDLEHVAPQLRCRGVDRGLVGHLAVADPGQHVPERVAHRHLGSSRLTSST